MSRMRDGGLDTAPIWTDVRTLDGRPWRGCVDIISGGFPCQDISIAGECMRKQQGIDGARSGLWKSFKRIIGEVRPRYAFVENVPRIISLGLDQILSDFAEMGYDVEWGCITAACCGAWHKSERFFALATNDNIRCEGRTARKGLQREHKYPLWGNADSIEALWSRPDIPQPTIWGGGNGVASRMDRVATLRNGVVPQQAALAWQILSQRINLKSKHEDYRLGLWNLD